MRFVRTATQIASSIFANCLLWVRQNSQQSQIICCSKNSTASQNKQHDIHFISVYRIKHMTSHIHSVFMYWMKHVISHIHSVFMYWMKHVTFQLSECSCLHSFILFYLFNLNHTSTSLYILRLEHTFLILYFLHYIVTKSNDIFQKKSICYRYDAVMTSS